MAPKRKAPSSVVLREISDETQPRDETSNASFNLTSAEPEQHISSKKSPEEEDNNDDMQIDIPKKRGKKDKSSLYLIGFCIDIAWCKKEKWSELLDLLAFQNWTTLVSVCANESLYEEEMSKFCLRFENIDGMCMSIVDGELIRFDEKILGGWFDVPHEGFNIYIKGKQEVTIEGASRADIMTFFGQPPTSYSLHQTELSPLHKLLLHLVWRFLIPRDSKRTQASLLDLSIIYCLIHNFKINFPSLMISHLTHCITNKNKIGYGALITHIFKKSKLKLPSTPSFNLEPENYLTKTTLSRLSLKVINGKIEFENKKEEEQAQVVVDECSDAKKQIRKSGRLAKSPSTKAQSLVMIDEDDPTVPALTATIEKLQEQVSDMSVKIRGIEAALAHLPGDLQQLERHILEKIDASLALVTKP